MTGPGSMDPKVRAAIADVMTPFPRHPLRGTVCALPVGACAEEHHAPRHAFPVDARGAGEVPCTGVGRYRGVLSPFDYQTTSARVVTR